jgi:hypothetical protein
METPGDAEVCEGQVHLFVSHGMGIDLQGQHGRGVAELVGHLT